MIHMHVSQHTCSRVHTTTELKKQKTTTDHTTAASTHTRCRVDHAAPNGSKNDPKRNAVANAGTHRTQAQSAWRPFHAITTELDRTTPTTS